MRPRTLMLGVLLVTVSLSTSTLARSRWKSLGTVDGVKVYRQSDPVAGVYSVRGVGVIEASVEEVYRVMSDAPRTAAWMPMSEPGVPVKVLSVVSPSERVELTLQRFPWPLAGRYTVCRARAERAPNGAIHVAYESVPASEAPVQQGRVLARVLEGVFDLTPEGNSRTRVEIRMRTDPGGQIPKALVNQFQYRWPADFIRGLDREVARDRARSLVAH